MLAIAQMIIPRGDLPLVLPLSKLKPYQRPCSVSRRIPTRNYNACPMMRMSSMVQEPQTCFNSRPRTIPPSGLHGQSFTGFTSCFLDRGAETSSNSMKPSWQSTKVLSRVSDYNPISTQLMPPDSERSPISFFEAASSQRLASPSAWFRDQRYVRILRWVQIQRRARTNRRTTQTIITSAGSTTNPISKA
jgi:hypothetical protein